MDMLKYGKYFITFLVLVNLLTLISAAGESTTIKSAMCSIVRLVRSVMGAVMMVLILLAAIIYAAGQVMGAETRARANVWATSMFVGAIVGALIYLVVPLFLSFFIPNTTDITTICGKK